MSFSLMWGYPPPYFWIQVPPCGFQGLVLTLWIQGHPHPNPCEYKVTTHVLWIRNLVSSKFLLCRFKFKSYYLLHRCCVTTIHIKSSQVAILNFVIRALPTIVLDSLPHFIKWLLWVLHEISNCPLNRISLTHPIKFLKKCCFHFTPRV